MEILRKHLFTALVVLFITSCAREPSDLNLDGTGVIAAYTIVEAGLSEVTTIIAASARMQLPELIEAQVGHKGRDHILSSSSGGCAQFGGERARCYQADLSERIGPGDTLTLRVRSSGFSDIIGSTVIPPEPAVAVPGNAITVVAQCPNASCEAEPFRPPVAEFPFTATSGLTAGLLDVSLHVRKVYAAGMLIDGAECRIEHAPTRYETPISVTSRLFVRRISCSVAAEQVTWDSVRVELKALNYDSAYARYNREILDADAIQPLAGSFGLKQGFGVLAAAGVTAKDVLVVKSQ